MNLYKIHPKADYLSLLADFIIENFKDNLSNLKVILPTGFACNDLLRNMIKKQNFSFLPATISFADILAEGEEIFKIPSEEVIRVSYLEQKMILAGIIYDFDKLNLSIIQSLKFTDSLSNLFHELGCNQISIDEIRNLSTASHAEHWQFIYEFLNYSYENWQLKLKKIKKTSHADYQNTMLKSEASRLKTEDNAIILVAGIFGQDTVTWQFLKEIAEIPQGYIVLPPLPAFDDQTIEDEASSADEALYCLHQLLKVLNKKLSDFKYIAPAEQLCVLDKLLIPFNSHTAIDFHDDYEIKYQEFEDIFCEAEAIASLCAARDNEKIAIVVKNEKAKEFYNNFLIRKNCNFQDQFGINVSKINIACIVNSICEILCSEFDLTKLFILLKNPIINSGNVIKLEQVLNNKNRFVKDFAGISELVQLTHDIELIKWWQDIAIIFKDSDSKKTNFHDFLKNTLSVSEKICQRLWQYEYGFEVSQFFKELITLKADIIIQNAEDFPIILKMLIAGARVYAHQKDTNIAICKPGDALLSKFDLIILADFSEGNWPIPAYASPWLNKQMEDELKFYSSRIKLSTNLYQFYLLLHNKTVVITRSLKQMNNVELSTSSYMMKLFHLASDLVLPLAYKAITDDNYASKNQVAEFVYADNFPSKLSATDIETLVRSPYSFYAKKILGLKKQDSIAEHPKLSEFGSFIHTIIEHYTKSYHQITGDKLLHFMKTGDALLDNILLPTYTKKIWKVKFKTIVEEFIKFDEELRASNKQTFSEIRGETKIVTSMNNIIITAIADRIEVNSNGGATILDYKTGALPSKQDVLAGLSPQLIIEAIILLNGGFNIKVQNIEKLIYVKIASSEPFIQTLEIAISPIELNSHLNGLTELLEHYIASKAFSTKIDLSKYNDYLHLARKL